MVVDCHTHIKCAGLEKIDLSEHLEAASVVDKCVVLAGDGGPADKSNEHLSEYVGKYHEKMVGFAFIDPISFDVNEKLLKAATEKIGLKGVVLYCSQTRLHPSHSNAFRLYEAAQTLQLPVFFHNIPVGPGGFLEYAQPLLLDEVARTFPNLKIIVGNMGFPFYEQTICLLAKHQNVYADLSVKPGNHWGLFNVVISAYEQRVMDKLLFGSAFPAAKAQDCIEALLGINRLFGGTGLPSVPRDYMQNIVERDALKLLGIEK